MNIARPDMDDLPRRNWTCDFCAAENDSFDAGCQYCDRDGIPDDMLLLDDTDWCAYDSVNPENVMHGLTRAEAESFARAKLVQEWIASTEANYKNLMARDFP